MQKSAIQEKPFLEESAILEEKPTLEVGLSLKDRFERKVVEWEESVTTIQSLTSKIRKILSADLTKEQSDELQVQFHELGAAFTCFQQQAECPELVLATTGTTSSGKSTLANFLIGEAILPAAVQEMSAGLVRVKHSHKRRLTIPKTRGATWETGRWNNLTASEVCQRLEATMNAFRQAEDNDEEIEPVVFEVEWPIRLAERKKELGLPEGTQVTIIDLPGLKAVNDERNGPVIRQNISKAFCLMAYNAEETDRVKQRTLLNQVVNQVMALSYAQDYAQDEDEIQNDEEQSDKTQDESVTAGKVSLLRRMLFLLNRVDAFYRHDDAVEQLEKFKGEVTNQLREKLEVALPGHEDVIDQIELTQVCSLPALLAVEVERLRDDPNNQAKALKKLKRLFQQIFPEDYFDDFPSKCEKFTEEQRREVVAQTFVSSYSNAFEQSLAAHIEGSFIELTLGASLRSLSLISAQISQKLDTLLEHYIVRTEQEAAEKLRCLEQAKVELANSVCEIFGIYERICAVLNNTEEDMEIRFGDLRAPCFELGDYVGKQDALLPLVDAMDNVLYEPRRDLLFYVNEFMDGEDPVPTPLMIGSSMLDKFNAALEQLKNSAYHRYYREGCAFLGASGEASAVKDALVAFVPVLSNMTIELIQKTLTVSACRIQEAFTDCSEEIFAKIKDIIAKETTLFTDFPGLYAIFEGEITYAPPPSMEVKYSYTVDKEVKTFTKEQEVPRNFLTKWIFGRKIKEVKEHKEGIVVPSLGEIFSDFGGESDRTAATEVHKLLTYISESLLDPFMEELMGRIDKGVSAYQKAIEASIGTITEGSKQKNDLLEGYKCRIAEAVSKIHEGSQ